MIKYTTISFIILALFSGCTTIAPTISEYRIQKHSPSPVKVKEQRCKKYSLKVAQAFSVSDLMRKDMNYGVGEFEQFTFSQSKWATPPNKAITLAFRNFLNEVELFKNVQLSQSRSRNDLLLEISVNDFMQYYTKDEMNSFVNTEFSLTLIDIRTSRVVATKTFKNKEVLKDINAKSGVKALNAMLAKTLTQSSKWLSGVCK